MRILNQLSLRTKLLLMLVVPSLALAWIAQIEVRQMLQLEAQSEHAIELTNFAAIASSMIHEMQKERGMSAGYLGSNGRKFVHELTKQRIQTDKRIKELRESISTFNTEFYGRKFTSSLSDALARFDILPEIRNRISAQAIGLDEGIGYYTTTNANYLDLIAYLPNLIEVSSISNAGTAYVAFMQSKERAGIERAVLANVFGADQFNPGMYDKLTSLVTTQNTYLSVFRSLATDEQKKFLSTSLEDNAVIEANRLRQHAISNAMTGNFAIEPTYWFKVQTDKINLLKAVEDRLANDLNALSIATQKEAVTNTYFALVVTAVSILMSILVCFTLSRMILNQLGADPVRLYEVAEAVSEGNLSIDLSTEKKPRGVFAIMHTMRDNLLTRAEEDRIRFNKNSRVREALNNANSPVIITDNSFDITFGNIAAEELAQNHEAQFRQDLPNFCAADLLTSSIDMFYKDPQEQRKLFENLTSPHKSILKLGGRSISTVVSPVKGNTGNNIGYVFEFDDRTEEIAMGADVQRVVDSALAGNLGQRIDTEQMTGFFETLSLAVNQLVDIAENVIDDTARVLSAMAAGDLTKTIEGDYQGSFDKLKRDANTTVDRLSDIVANIMESANSVKNGSDEISQGNVSLSDRTQQQAASLEQTSSSMVEMTSTVEQNADNAAEANQLAIRVREQAEVGGQVVEKAIEAMQDINTSSTRISDIIGVIDEIAFQTNLLALNAAVEAARAGEQGRGFAVVASEVRSLAGRSASAAKEIKDLIIDSEGKVVEGSRLVNESGQSLIAIVDGVKKVTGIVGEIATASKEQSAGIAQASQALTQMDELTQQNTALVEEVAAASESLNDEAKDLSQMTSFFTIKPSNAPQIFYDDGIQELEERQFGS